MGDLGLNSLPAVWCFLVVVTVSIGVGGRLGWKLIIADSGGDFLLLDTG